MKKLSFVGLLISTIFLSGCLGGGTYTIETNYGRSEPLVAPNRKFQLSGPELAEYKKTADAVEIAEESLKKIAFPLVDNNSFYRLQNLSQYINYYPYEQLKPNAENIQYKWLTLDSTFNLADPSSLQELMGQITTKLPTIQEQTPKKIEDVREEGFAFIFPAYKVKDYTISAPTPKAVFMFNLSDKLTLEAPLSCAVYTHYPVKEDSKDPTVLLKNSLSYSGADFTNHAITFDTKGAFNITQGSGAPYLDMLSADSMFAKAMPELSNKLLLKNGDNDSEKLKNAFKEDFEDRYVTTYTGHPHEILPTQGDKTTVFRATKLTLKDENKKKDLVFPNGHTTLFSGSASSYYHLNFHNHGTFVVDGAIATFVPGEQYGFSTEESKVYNFPKKRERVFTTYIAGNVINGPSSKTVFVIPDILKEYEKPLLKMHRIEEVDENGDEKEWQEEYALQVTRAIKKKINPEVDTDLTLYSSKESAVKYYEMYKKYVGIAFNFLKDRTNKARYQKIVRDSFLDRVSTYKADGELYVIADKDLWLPENGDGELKVPLLFVDRFEGAFKNIKTDGVTAYHLGDYYKVRFKAEKKEFLEEEVDKIITKAIRIGFRELCMLVENPQDLMPNMYKLYAVISRKSEDDPVTQSGTTSDDVINRNVIGEGPSRESMNPAASLQSLMGKTLSSELSKAFSFANSEGVYADDSRVAAVVGAGNTLFYGYASYTNDRTAQKGSYNSLSANAETYASIMGVARKLMPDTIGFVGVNYSATKLAGQNIIGNAAQLSSTWDSSVHQLGAVAMLDSAVKVSKDFHLNIKGGAYYNVAASKAKIDYRFGQAADEVVPTAMVFGSLETGFTARNINLKVGADFSTHGEKVTPKLSFGVSF